jgi:RecJ-like exonuclease
MMFAMMNKKPHIGVSAFSKTELKISGRALEKHKVNLGDVMNKAAIGVGGAGGGHKLAAGATIPKEKLEEFLLFLNESIPVCA